ncbi:thioredoxin family protein [bacterium]|nr:thioredoxin family protein [bacterium]
MTEQFFLDRRPHNALDYETYLEIMKTRADTPADGLDEEAAERVGYTKLNLHRSQRIGRTYTVSDELGARLDRIAAPRIWMVLTEPWCGDSAQCLPHLAVMARRNPLIDLRILPRDENLDVMDLYLTGESRSIPQLVVFDTEGNELWRWGPRPAAAQVVFDQAKAEGLEKPALLERLHLWYGRDRGREVEREITGLVI